jgi:glycosyltransferase involved in cell wall biosynthesis
MIVYNNYFTDPRVKRYADTLVDAGYEVDVFALGKSHSIRPGLRVFGVLPAKVFSQTPLPTIGAQILFLLLATLQVGAQAVRRRYCLVHVHNMPDFIVFSAVVPRLLGARVILDIHDTGPEAYATKFDVPLSHPVVALARVEEVVSAAFADSVITTNELHEAAITEHGIPKQKIRVIMNLADPRLFHPCPRQTKHDGLTLVYHGTIAQRLGLDLMIEAIRRSRADCPNLKFLLFGNGEYFEHVRGMVTEYELEDVVEVGGVVPVDMLPALLARADVGVIGNRLVTESRHNWMLPVKMLEYAAMEIPTIAPRLRVIRHYFDDSNALFYEPDNVEDLARCIRSVYQRPEQLRGLKDGLRHFNARYSWTNAASGYVDLVDHFAQVRGRQ